MKSVLLLRTLAMGMLILSGCVSTSSHVLVGTERSPIDPSQVKLFLHPPTNYEEIALLAADSRNSRASSEQAKMDAAIAALKAEAAKLGANGILLSTTGDQFAGSTSYGSGVGFLGSGATTLLWNGASFSTPVFNKAATGIAIFVPPR